MLASSASPSSLVRGQITGPCESTPCLPTACDVEGLPCYGTCKEKLTTPLFFFPGANSGIGYATAQILMEQVRSEALVAHAAHCPDGA